MLPGVQYVVALLIGSLTFACKIDEDCSLNGICSQYSSTCTCDLGWRGDDCGEVDIYPAKRNSGYNRTSEGISSWGSKIVQDPYDKNLYHAFLAEFDNHCGLDYWAPYSRIIRAESRTGPDGPYAFAEEVVGHFAHNPTVVYSPADKLYLLYYIGCPQQVNETCTDPSFTCGPGNHHNGESGISVLSSPDLKSWTPHGQVKQGKDTLSWNAVVTNPSPLPLYSCHQEPTQPNTETQLGYVERCETDILLVYRGCPMDCDKGPETELIGLATASKFDRKYISLNNDQPIFDNPAEDPFVWRDARGNYHMLVHSLEKGGGFGDGPKVGRHAFARSYEGPWHFNTKTLAFTTYVEFDDGSDIDFYRRERAQFFFSDDGNMTPLYMTTGVQEKNSSMSYSIIVPIGHGGTPWTLELNGGKRSAVRKDW